MPATGSTLTGPRAAAAGFALWAVVTVAALGWGLGGPALVDPDEGRNAEVGREMAASGDWVVPHLNGLPYLDKPVLYFAAGAAAMRLLGPSETSARLPSLLAALATAALAAAFAAHLFGAGAAWIAGLATAGAPLTLAFARTVIFDSLLTLFITLALAAFYLAVEAAGEGRRYAGWTALAWGAMGLGVLTKGPVALVVPLLAAIPFALWRRASRAVWHPAGPAAAAVVVAPWVWAVSRRLPEFLDYVLVTESWRRLTTPELQRTGPIWTFVPVLLGGALPWSAVGIAGAVGAFRRRRPTPAVGPEEGNTGGENPGRASRGRPRRADPRAVYLALWIVLPFLLFSLSASKRPQYVLPLVPAVALAVAGLWSAWRPEGDRELPGAQAAAIVWALLGGVVLTAVALYAPPASMTPELAARVPGAAAALGGAMFAGGLSGWLAASRPGPALAALGLPVLAAPILLLPVLEQIGAQRSARELAAAVAPRLAAAPDAEVVGVGAYPPSLTFYLGRPLLLATADADELRSNYLLRYHDRWAAAEGTTLRPADWWRRALAACERPRVFVAEKRDAAVQAALGESGAGLPLILDDGRHVAYGPCAPPGSRPGPGGAAPTPDPAVGSGDEPPGLAPSAAEG